MIVPGSFKISDSKDLSLLLEMTAVIGKTIIIESGRKGVRFVRHVVRSIPHRRTVPYIPLQPIITQQNNNNTPLFQRTIINP